MNTPRHSVSVSGVIPDDHGRVLLIRRRDNQHWEPPGGVLELAETIQDGLRREVREETGLEVEPDALTGVYKNMARGVVALVFRCKIVGGQLAANDEVTAFRDPALCRDHSQGLESTRRKPDIGLLMTRHTASITRCDTCDLDTCDPCDLDPCDLCRDVFSTVSRAHLRRATPDGQDRATRGGASNLRRAGRLG